MALDTQMLHAALQLPHGYCYLWDPGLIWLHALSDGLIGAAYFAIPIVLARFLRQRKDIPFNGIVWCFAVFILACGATHWISVVNIWVPSWWTSGGLKALTAAASLPTAFLLHRMTPMLVALPSPTQLHAANATLAAEIAERKKIEQMLRESQAELEKRVEERTTELARANASLRLLESAVTQSTDAFTITTGDLDAPGPKIVFANPAMTRITGYPLDDLLGKTPRILQGPKTDHEMLSEMRRTLTETGAFAGETLNYRADGGEFVMSWKVTPIRDEDGMIGHYLAVQRDVTEQRDLELQFRQAQKMEAVGQLAGGIAHDFNNLLTAIQGNCALLMEDIPAPDPRRVFVEEIDDAGARAARLTRQLLAFSRRQIRQPTAISLDVVVTDALRLLGRLLGERIDVRFAPTKDLGLVWADPDQLEQVVLNLAVNARDAMPQGGTLTIETANVELDGDYAGMHMSVIPGSYVMLCVTDTGSGMPPETITRIFEPFFTTKPVGQGTGLGLSTLYGIVKQSRGNVWVYSEPGRGTTFKVYLPRVSDPAVRVTRPTPVSSTLVLGSGVVLLVEDDPAVRSLAARMLRRAGYDVIDAATPAIALEIARDESVHIDILLTDVVMAGLTGPELAAAVRERRPSIRVAFMSGYTDTALDAHQLADAHAVLISKPFTGSSLTAQIAKV